MKEIKLPITQTFSLTIDTHNIDLSQVVAAEDGILTVNLGNIVDEDKAREIETARLNGGQILYATTSIEQKMEGLLLEYFMGPFIPMDERRSLFEREILQSSALSYKAKKDLVTKVVHEAALLVGKKKSLLQEHLTKVMEWRNAFAHGKIQHDTLSGCFIKYHSGRAQSLNLTDAFWSQVERCFADCEALLGDAMQTLAQQHTQSKQNQK